jgi:hypothetical protein
VMEEYFRRMYGMIRGCEGIAKVQGADRLLIEQAQLYVLMQR